MTDTQYQVQQAIDRLVESGAEQGLQVAVYRHGEPVVDTVAGVADPTTGRPVTSDTLFFSYSIGKGVASTVVHVLAERGILDYDTRIAELWPEFGAHGKEGATVRHALSQSVGVPGLPSGLTAEDLTNWEKMRAIIVDSEPWWEPGTKIGYHAITWGYVVGEIIRRATGKLIPQALREEVAERLGVTNELFFAVPVAEQRRVARLEDAPGSEEMFGDLPEDSLIFKLGPDLSAADANRSEVLGANILAGGTVTARAVARMYAALLGEVDGVRLISPGRLREVSAVAMSGTDQIFGFPTSWGLGYAIGQFMSNAHETQHIFGVGGVGGSYAYADTRTGTTFALAKNRLAPNFDTAEHVAEIVTKAVADNKAAAQRISIHRGELTQMTPAGTHIEANGLRIYYEVHGEGEPLLLVHGGTATSQSWASHLPAFAEHFRVFAPDSRGHGKSDNPTGELSYRMMANDVAALVGALGLQRPLVLGYSDGGQIALELGIRYPGLVRALVLGGTQFRFSEAYLKDARALLGIAEGEEIDPERLEREQPDFVGYLREAHGHAYGPEYWKAYVRQISSLWLTPLHYTYEDLAAVTDPVLILVGDRDGACTAEAPELFRLLPDAELAVAPGSDHGFIEAKAGLFDALALDFLLRHQSD